MWYSKYGSKCGKWRDKVLFLGHVDYDNLADYYSLADVFVRPSLSEGFGNVFL